MWSSTIIWIFNKFTSTITDNNIPAVINKKSFQYPITEVGRY